MRRFRRLGRGLAGSPLTVRGGLCRTGDAVYRSAMPNVVDWSVRLLLTDDESTAVFDHRRWPIHDAVNGMHLGGWLEDGIEDAPFVTLMLSAETREAAEDLAQDIVARTINPAGLPGRKFPVVWVTPRESTEADGHRFLEQAKELFEAEQYDLAVVAAQMHFEIQLRLLLQRAAGRVDRPWATRLVKNRRAASLSSDVSVGTVELLLQIDVRALADWADFRAHLERRNAVAHTGLAVSSRDARASIKVVERLWATLAEAERATTLF